MIAPGKNFPETVNIICLQEGELGGWATSGGKLLFLLLLMVETQKMQKIKMRRGIEACLIPNNPIVRNVFQERTGNVHKIPSKKICVCV